MDIVILVISDCGEDNFSGVSWGKILIMVIGEMNVGVREVDVVRINFVWRLRKDGGGIVVKEDGGWLKGFCFVLCLYMVSILKLEEV